MSGKPVHPALVHFPLTFLLSSSSLDILLHLAPTTLSSTFSLPVPTLYLFSHKLLILGLLFAIPTVMSGGAQISKLLQRAGKYESDGQTLRPKVKTAFAHAASSDVALLIAAWRWYVNRQNFGDLGEGKVGGVQNLVLSVLSLAVLLFSANLGGSLVYNHGVGSAMGNKGKKTN